MGQFSVEICTQVGQFSMKLNMLDSQTLKSAEKGAVKTTQWVTMQASG